MQIGKFGFQLGVIVRGPRDVARAAGPCPASIQRFVHCRKNFGVLSHPEVVIRAPDRHGLLRLAAMRRCIGKRSAFAFKFCKYPVVSVFL